ncbi:MAG: transporter substrate-binding domain-containing protein [Dongiaceae bacterium]
MKRIRPLSLLAAGAIVAALAGAPRASLAADDALELVTPGTLTIGFNPTPGIFEVAEDGTVSGIYGILMTEIAKRLGLKPTYVPLAFPALIPAVQSHRVDVNSGSFSITQPRAQILYYGTPWLFGPETIAVTPGTKIPSWEYAAKNGLTLATGVGYYYVGIWEEMKINLHTFDSDDACFLDVTKGASAGCAVGVLTHLLRKVNAPDSPAAKLESIVVTGPRVLADPNGLAVAKEHPVLARALSRAVDELHRDGSIEKTTCQVLKNVPECTVFLQPPAAHGLYLPGPWETDTTPPAAADYPKDVPTIAAGVLTVGVGSGSPLLQLDGDALKGPEADILSFVAGKLGLKLKGVSVSDPTAALKAGQVDIAAGALPATEQDSHKYWQTIPIGFDPDYIYVAPDKDGAYPGFTKWEDVKAANGKIAVVKGNPRIADLTAAGADLLVVENAAAGLHALADKSAAGFVGSSLDYVAAASADPDLAKVGIGWTRNTNSYSSGVAFAWGVKAGNAKLIDALNQGIVAAWQGKAIATAYGNAFRGANSSVLAAPGPTAVGTSFATSKDFVFRAMWLPGPWAQRPGWVN